MQNLDNESTILLSFGLDWLIQALVRQLGRTYENSLRHVHKLCFQLIFISSHDTL